MEVRTSIDETRVSTSQLIIEIGGQEFSVVDDNGSLLIRKTISDLTDTSIRITPKSGNAIMIN